MATDTNILNYPGELQDVFFSKRDSSGEVDIANQIDSTPKNPVGCLTRFKGNIYRYVYFVAGTTVAGAPAYWSALDPSSADPTASFAVHRTATSAIDGKGNNTVAGVFLAAAITAARYIWIQVGGIASCAVSGSTVAGDKEIGGSNDVFGRLAYNASETDLVFGLALAADTANIAPILLLNMVW